MLLQNIDLLVCTTLCRVVLPKIESYRSDMFEQCYTAGSPFVTVLIYQCMDP